MGNWLKSLSGKTIAGFVAASNATAAETAMAEFTCDGTADEVQLMAAEAAGPVICSSGTFNIDDTCTFDTGNPVRGQGSGERSQKTLFNITGTDHGVLIQNATTAINRLQGVTIKTPASFNTVALRIYATSELWDMPELLRDVHVRSYLAGVSEGTVDVTAGSRGIQIEADAGFVAASFNDCRVSGFQYGLHILVDKATGYQYFNGNQFNNWWLKYSVQCMRIEVIDNGASGMEIAGNQFSNFQFQPNANSTTDYGIVTIGPSTAFGAKFNIFDPLFFWDWETLADHAAMYSDAGGGSNQFKGWWHATAKDTGSNTIDGTELNTYTRYGGT